MSNLSDELHVSPRQRITVPENHNALILSQQLTEELKSLCLIIRKRKNIPAENKEDFRAIAGDLLLAIMEAVQ